MTTRSGSRAARSLVCVALAGALGACAGAMQSRPEDIPRLEQAVTASATPVVMPMRGPRSTGRSLPARATHRPLSISASPTRSWVISQPRVARMRSTWRLARRRR
jgi:hypothetical protein